MRKKPALTQTSEKKSNIIHWILLIAIAALVSSLLTLLFYSFFVVKDVSEIEFDLNVANYTGINLDKDKLHFGAVMPDSKAHRYITLAADEREIVEIEINGPEFVYPSEYKFTMNKGEIRKIMFTALPPISTTKGFYIGTIIITTKRPLAS